MTIATCPYPSNINPLYLNSFQFNIAKLPELTYFVQATQIPQVNLGVITQAGSVHDSKVPGETMSFADISIKFIVDEEMSNWNAIYYWMIGLGFPINNKMYTEFLKRQDNLRYLTELNKGYSDGTLTLLSNTNTPKQIFTFVDMFPTSLSGLEFDSEATDARPATATATFAYTYYTMNKQSITS